MWTKLSAEFDTNWIFAFAQRFGGCDMAVEYFVLEIWDSARVFEDVLYVYDSDVDR